MSSYPNSIFVEMGLAVPHVISYENAVGDYEEVLHQVYDMLEGFWLQSDPLVRMNMILEAQRRIESVL